MDVSRRRFLITTLSFAVVALASILITTPSRITAQPGYSDWSGPAHLGALVNSTTTDTAPAISRDGRSLFFQSPRPGFFGEADIFVSQRNTVEEEWGMPTNLGAFVNSAVADIHPALSRDEHWLFFASARPGGSGALDIWASYREDVHDNFAWQSPVNLGPGVNSTAVEQDPSFFQNDDAGIPQLFFSRGPMNAEDIYVSSSLPDGTFGPGTPVAELNTTASDRGLSVRFDGLEVFFMSTRPGGFGSTDLWTATRDTMFDSWSAPTNLGALVNSSGMEQVPEIASDRETLYFATIRPGTVGFLDLYMATRTKNKQD
jgi:hypothetical protein